MRLGIATKAYTGMRIENRPYHLMYTRKYWIGAKMKNAQKSAAWSGRAVGVSVMNSRIARNDMIANNTTELTPPVTTAIPKTNTITHHARMRAFRFFTVARAPSLLARMDRIQPTIDATTSSAITPPPSLTIAELVVKSIIGLGERASPRARAREMPPSLHPAPVASAGRRSRAPAAAPARPLPSAEYDSCSP